MAPAEFLQRCRIMDDETSAAAGALLDQDAGIEERLERPEQ
jgi:hypothetical protein